MVQQLWTHSDRFVRVVFVVVVMLLGGQVFQAQARPQAVAAVRPAVIVQVLDVNCVSVPSIDMNYIKLADLGAFTVQSADSTVELTFNGRIFVSSFGSGTGASFELRVDEAASTVGRARANLRTAEAGGGGRQVSLSGFFNGLAPGEHTASMWVRTSSGGSGNQAMVDPGCWSTDVLIVREYVPFGFTYMPAIMAP